MTEKIKHTLLLDAFAMIPNQTEDGIEVLPIGEFLSELEAKRI